MNTSIFFSQNSERLKELLVGKVINVDGGIGVGKSEFVTNLAMSLSSAGIPVEVTPEVYDPFLLTAFNDDPSTYAMLFQQHMMCARLCSAKRSEAIAKQGEKVVVQDTGILRELAFTRANYECKNMTMKGYHSHMENYITTFESVGCPQPDYIILLDASAQRCKRNIIKRSRGNEVGIPEAYLDAINRSYRIARDEVLNHEILGNKITKMITVNVDTEYADPRVVNDLLI